MKNSMLRALTALFCLSVLSLISKTAYAGDTGTYKILSYKVALVLHSDGTVSTDYYQKWEVTGGHIPWITIGMPNDNYTIQNSGLNAKKASSASEGGWSGIRIDLDRDYRPGETFEVNVRTVQNRLFYADDDNYRIEFTPGWYDRAFIDELEIAITCFADPKKVKTAPPPYSVSEDLFIWKKTGMGKGARYKVSLAFPKSIASIPEKNLKSNGTAGSALIIILFIVLVIAVIVAIASASEGGSGGGYSGGSIFYGGGDGGSSSRSGSGGGGFGGRSSSCACACVSCACACACAGGGGAGCSRKNQHHCKHCEEEEKDE